MSQCYEFDTGKIFGGIEPYSNYHGICGLMHQNQQFNLVRPKKAFLNAEYYIRPGSKRKMLPRDISRERKTTHELQEDTVLIHFPSEPEYGFYMDLRYRPHDDMVDMQMTITPMKDIPKFEIFFASYVCEAFDETWALLRNSDGTQEWVKLHNRETLNSIFRVMRSESMFALLVNEYGPDFPVHVENRVFDKPILIARNSKNGLALIYLCDPQQTHYLAGQYHGWDTAHDWAYGTDLSKGDKFHTETRMVCRSFKNIDLMFADVEAMWNDFVKGC